MTGSGGLYAAPCRAGYSGSLADNVGEIGESQYEAHHCASSLFLLGEVGAARRIDTAARHGITEMANAGRRGDSASTEAVVRRSSLCEATLAPWEWQNSFLVYSSHNSSVGVSCALRRQDRSSFVVLITRTSSSCLIALAAARRCGQHPHEKRLEFGQRGKRTASQTGHAQRPHAVVEGSVLREIAHKGPLRSNGRSVWLFVAWRTLYG